MLYVRITETQHLTNYHNTTNQVPLTVSGTDDKTHLRATKNATTNHNHDWRPHTMCPYP